jgi:hypothetical protein
MKNSRIQNAVYHVFGVHLETKKISERLRKNSYVFWVSHLVSVNALVSSCIVTHPFSCPSGLSHALPHTSFRPTSRGRHLCPVYHDTCTEACSPVEGLPSAGTMSCLFKCCLFSLCRVIVFQIVETTVGCIFGLFPRFIFTLTCTCMSGWFLCLFRMTTHWINLSKAALRWTTTTGQHRCPWSWT